MKYFKAALKFFAVWLAYMLASVGIVLYFELDAHVGFWVGFAGGAMSWLTSWRLGFLKEVY